MSTYAARQPNFVLIMADDLGYGDVGQFILMLPELDLIIVTTAHNKGMGKTLANTSIHLLPAFVQ
jgi:hypothetical protein